MGYLLYQLVQDFFHQQYEFGKFNPLNALHLLHSEVTPPPLRHNVSLDRFGLSTYPGPRYLHTKHRPKLTLARLGLRWVRIQVQLSKIISPIQSLKNFLKKSSQILPSSETHQISRILFFSRWLFNNFSQELDMWLGSLEGLLILSKIPRWKKFNKNSPRHSELGFSFVEFRRGNVEGADGADIFHDAGAHFRGVTWEVEVLCVPKVEDLKTHSVCWELFVL